MPQYTGIHKVANTALRQNYVRNYETMRLRNYVRNF